eukprot:10302-Heterococcus_DN1.PRE.3
MLNTCIAQPLAVTRVSYACSVVVLLVEMPELSMSPVEYAFLIESESAEHLLFADDACLSLGTARVPGSYHYAVLATTRIFVFLEKGDIANAKAAAARYAAILQNTSDLVKQVVQARFSPLKNLTSSSSVRESFTEFKYRYVLDGQGVIIDSPSDYSSKKQELIDVAVRTLQDAITELTKFIAQQV